LLYGSEHILLLFDPILRSVHWVRERNAGVCNKANGACNSVCVHCSVVCTHRNFVGHNRMCPTIATETVRRERHWRGNQQANYDARHNDRVTAQVVSQTRSLLGSPFDRRLTVLCGATYVDATGCTPP
jgi:hypothetical protein